MMSLMMSLIVFFCFSSHLSLMILFLKGKLLENCHKYVQTSKRKNVTRRLKHLDHLWTSIYPNCPLNSTLCSTLNTPKQNSARLPGQLGQQRASLEMFEKGQRESAVASSVHKLSPLLEQLRSCNKIPRYPSHP